MPGSGYDHFPGRNNSPGIAGDPGGIISAGKMIIPGAGHTDIL